MHHFNEAHTPAIENQHWNNTGGSDESCYPQKFSRNTLEFVLVALAALFLGTWPHRLVYALLIIDRCVSFVIA